MFFCLILLRLLAEDDLAGLAVHGLHNGKALQLDALAADQLAALLEALPSFLYIHFLYFLLVFPFLIPHTFFYINTILFLLIFSDFFHLFL